jgi:hypothetical protein
MQVGDLVFFDSEWIFDATDHIGIIIDLLETPDGILYKIVWNNNQAGWFHEVELEAVNGLDS